MQDLSLHLLDIMENSASAGAKSIHVRIVEDSAKDILSIEIRDDGKGMDAATCEKALDPFFTTRKSRRVGLGIPLLAQAAKDCDGHFSLSSIPGKGTTVKATFRKSHPDMKPMGDLQETLTAFLAGNPGIALTFEYDVDGAVYRLDSGNLVDTPNAQAVCNAISEPEKDQRK